ncbi:MAG: hypothetical protein V4727_04305 [Verrucomicrobiota bacterium]
MTIIETIKSKLKKYPSARYTVEGHTITVEAANSDGFAVWLVDKQPGYTVGYDGWHEEFDDEEMALNAFAFGLSEDCRLKVIQRGKTACSWTVESGNREGQWFEDGMVGLLWIPFWRKRTTVYRQNHLIKNNEEG